MRRSKQDDTKETFNRAFVLPSEEQDCAFLRTGSASIKGGRG
jgi:hypothetical protein